MKNKMEKYFKEYKNIKNKNDYDFFDYWAPLLNKDKVFGVLSEDYINEKIGELETLGIDKYNVYFKLLGEALFLEKDLIKNREEIAYIYYLLSYTIIVWYPIPSGLEIATYYINKAIEITDVEAKKIEWIDFKNSDIFYNY